MRKFRILALLASALLALWACHLGTEQKTEEVFTFPALADSLKGSDSATILVTSLSGDVIDTLFDGPVTPATRFEGLVAPHYDGSKAKIVIEGRKDGAVVYKVEKSYDGASGRVDTTIIIVARPVDGPRVASVRILPDTLRLTAGGTMAAFAATVHPDTLSQVVYWRSLDTLIAMVSSGGMVSGRQAGSARVVATSALDVHSSDTAIVVVAVASKPESVRFDRAQLEIHLGGSAQPLAVEVLPPGSSQEVAFHVADAAVAEVLDGRVKGLKEGRTTVTVRSRVDTSLTDTLLVVVAGASKPESVRFDRAQLEIYLGGSAEPLVVEVLPLGSSQEVAFHVADATVAEVLDGRVKGLKEGRTSVTVRSREDTTLSDTLLVVVLPKLLDPVDSVTVSPDTLRLYTGGESLPLSAAIHPGTLPARFSWRTSSAAIARVDTTGKVSPVAPGRAFVGAVSLVDSTRRDSAVVIVRKDAPRISIGRDTTISVGQTLAYLPVITQDYGQVVRVRWDLDGNGTWDDSSAQPQAVSYRYAEAKEYLTRFGALDTEGNDTTVTRRVLAVNGPVVLIVQPADGTYTNQSPVTVTWSVDGAVQSSPEALKPGPNVIVRSSEAAGQTFSASVTVHYDTVPPGRPVVKGPTGPVSTLRPAWSWEPAGGGNGTYRLRLGSDNFTVGATVVTDTSYTPAANLAGGAQTLYVQERDLAGNWSATGSFTVRIDTTPPAAPVVSVLPAGPTNNRRPAWSWTGAASEGTSTYRYKLDNNDFRTGATLTTSAGFTPAPGAELPEGSRTLFVQHQDSAGNWSATGSAIAVIDLTPPAAPAVSAPASPTNDRTPTWTWTTRGGGSGNWRFKLGDRNLASGATETATPAYTPAADLAAGTHTLHVQERDAAGNWSPSDSASVTIDISAPGAPQVRVSPASPTRDQTPTWTWRSGTAATGDFRYKLNDANLNTGAVETRDTTFTPPADLAGGTWAVYVQERNAAGTWSASGSAAVRIDTTRPAAPTVTVTPASPTSERRPTWNWNKQEAGIGYFRYRLGAGTPRDTGATSFRPSVAGQLPEGTHTVYVQEGDSAGNWSAEGSAQVTIDLTPPPAPTVNGTASPTNDDTPTWTWSAGGPGGNATFRYRLDDTTMSGGTVTPELTYTPAALAAGSHTLHVQERDAAGNWSNRGSYSVVIDRTPPGAPVMNTTRPRTPLNSLRPTWTWASGGGGSGTYQVKIGNGDFSTGAVTVSDTAYTPPANLGQGPQVLFVRERDAAQNWSTASSRSIYLSPRDTLGAFGSAGSHVLVTSTGVVYTVISDPSGIGAVKQYNPGTDQWENAGSGQSVNNVLEMVLGPDDLPYIVGHTHLGPHVQRLDGTVWRDVGGFDVNATRLQGNYHSLAFTSTGVPLMGLTQYREGEPQGTLMRFNGTQWDLAKSTRVGMEPWFLKLDVGANDRAYMAFQDLQGMGNYVVTTDPLNQTSKWDTVGSGSAYDSNGSIGGLKMKCSGNQIYLGIITASSGVQLLTSSGGAFTSSTSAPAADFDLAVSGGIPYLAILRPDPPNNTITVRARINSTWMTVGAILQRPAGMYSPMLAVSRDGVPYVKFADEAANFGGSVIRTSFDPNQ